jgi:hypothetical protein
MRQAPSGTLQPPFEFGIQKLPRGVAVYREDKRMAALVARTRVVINGASLSRVLSTHVATK